MIDINIQKILGKEVERLNHDIELIASENYPSQDILDLMGSHFSVKYSEGFPLSVSKQGRHYAGCEIIDKLEEYAIENACKLFKCNYANVQPWSGSQANLAVYAGLLKPGDKILGMDLNAGGHLTHGSKASDSSKEYIAYYYGLDKDGYLNYDEIKDKLYEYRPSLLIVGASAYSRIIDFKKIRDMVDEYNAWQIENDNKNAQLYNEGKIGDLTPEAYPQYKYCYLMVDMAHIAGLVAAGVHPSPLPYADVVTSTTHKTLRGPRGGLILWNNSELCTKLNSGVFPKTQGGSNQAAIAAKCQCFIEAQQPSFRKYAKQILKNMQALIEGIKSADTEDLIDFVSKGSDNHLVLLDIKKVGIYGKEAEDRLTSYGIICNKNMIAGDAKPSECTGIRIGTAAITTRGFDEEMCYELGRIITKILTNPNCDEKSKEGIIDLEPISIKVKLSKMLDRIGSFYKSSFVNTYTDTDSDTPDDLA